MNEEYLHYYTELKCISNIKQTLHNQQFFFILPQHFKSKQITVNCKNK